MLCAPNIILSEISYSKTVLEMITDVLNSALYWSWCVLGSAAFREWCVVLAELIVAAVIYGELQESRNVAFLQKATMHETNEDRAEIYKAYFELQGTFNSLDEVSDAFNQQAFRRDEIRTACVKQLALFNELGLVHRKHFWWFRNRLVTVLPHAAIYMWVFYRSYVKSRREDSGLWFAKPMLEFTLESVKYALTFEKALRLRPIVELQVKKDLVVSVDDLKRIRFEITAELGRAR